MRCNQHIVSGATCPVSVCRRGWQISTVILWEISAFPWIFFFTWRKGTIYYKDLDTHDSGSERRFQLAMIQLGPVDFLKERMSQDLVLASLSQAAQAHGRVLGHELGEYKKERVIHPFIYNPVTRQRAPALAKELLGGFLADFAH